MRPSKRSLLVAACAENVIVPAMAVRVQRRSRLFSLVCATHLFPTLRPPAGSVNLKVTLAASLRVNVNVVPTGSFFVLWPALTSASRSPSRQILALWARLARLGVRGITIDIGGAGGGGLAHPGWAA